MRINIQHIKRVYFLGIGGIGMSALARYFHHLGKTVSGYDRTETQLTRALAAQGIVIHYHEQADKIPSDIDLVIYTPALPDDFSELQEVRRRGLPLMKRAEVLGLISRSKQTLAVAGTHGKTTTSAILAHLLQEGGVSASAFLGGIALNYNSNFISGHSDWVVVEADEYDRSFLHLSPTHAAILSTDADHLDIYGSHEQLMETGFRAFAKKVDPSGSLWVPYELADQFAEHSIKTFDHNRGDAQLRNFQVKGEGWINFDYYGPKAELIDLRWTMPGLHNALNATVAITLALEADASQEGIRKGLKSFKGIRRRFERIAATDRVVINDYAHHPTELQAAIEAARSLFPSKKITGVFQPHLFSRTRDFATGFAEALDDLDCIVLLDIYPAREQPMDGVTSELIYEQMTSTDRYRASLENMNELVADLNPEVLLILGAGDIDAHVPSLVNHLNQTRLRKPQK